MSEVSHERINAMLQELANQRNSAFDRCVLLAAELAEVKAKLKELEGATDNPPASIGAS